MLRFLSSFNIHQRYAMIISRCSTLGRISRSRSAAETYCALFTTHAHDMPADRTRPLLVQVHRSFSPHFSLLWTMKRRFEGSTSMTSQTGKIFHCFRTARVKGYIVAFFELSYESMSQSQCWLWKYHLQKRCTALFVGA